ncbi:MAG: LysM peptidoglycan-binding domain-containing protein [Candidatus Eiseniibacteriota bacterium]|nr:MAG: LysM peptidoglycan-binding domain-containing protein [Candidatus Eisenbacteria bacterium]
MRNRSLLILMAVALLALFLLAGCGKRVLRTADVSQGDYYTAEEFKKLSKMQRDAYCDRLENELGVQKQKAEKAGQSVAEADKKAAELEGKLADLDAQLAKLQAEVSELEARKAERDRMPETYTVVEGDCLYKISGYEKIYADPLKWPRLYRANRDKIKDPNLIYPDWVLVVPRGFPKEWVVYAGEYLSKIAGYWEIYDNSSEWPRIYEANKDQISDPDLIYPKQVLKIPR